MEHICCNIFLIWVSIDWILNWLCAAFYCNSDCSAFFGWFSCIICFFTFEIGYFRTSASMRMLSECWNSLCLTDACWVIMFWFGNVDTKSVEMTCWIDVVLLTWDPITVCQVIEDCPVSRIFTESNEMGWKKVTGVETPFGTIRTSCVLNASGVWSGSVAKLAGLSIPLVPMKHAYIVTEPIPGVQGYPNVRDHDGSVYIKMNGSSMSMGGYESNPIILKSVCRLSWMEKEQKLIELGHYRRI